MQCSQTMTGRLISPPPRLLFLKGMLLYDMRGTLCGQKGKGEGGK